MDLRAIPSQLNLSHRNIEPKPTTHPALHKNQEAPSEPGNIVALAGSHSRAQHMRTTGGAVVTRGEWPFGRVETSGFLGAERIKKMSAAAAEAGEKGLTPNTIGRPKPPISQQSIGRYVKKPVANWSYKRDFMNANIIDALDDLNKMPPGKKRDQLHLEIVRHFLDSSEAERVDILDKLCGGGRATLLDNKAPSAAGRGVSPMRNCIEHILSSLPREQTRRLWLFSEPKVKQYLRHIFACASNDDVNAVVKKRTAPLRHTMPLDHGNDYGGFIFENDRKIGQIPEQHADDSIYIAGAGPTGLILGDHLKRAGARNLHIEEARPQIAGRMAVVRQLDKEGRVSPTPLHPGSMRFNVPTAEELEYPYLAHTGNSIVSYIRHYGLEYVPFPNPSTVTVTGILNNDVYVVRPGGKSDNPLVEEVIAEFGKAINTLIAKPIQDARDAADTGTFFELCDILKPEFDPHSMRAAVESQLAKIGVTWDEKKWDIFNALGGLGVGGYKGYNILGFLEELRFIVDGRLENHVCLKEGSDAPFYRIIQDTQGLPEGAEPLENDIHLNTALVGVRKRDGIYYVTSEDKLTGEKTTKGYQHFFFTGSPAEAQRLGLTNPPQPGDEPLLDKDFAFAVEKSNMVDATKMAIKIPRHIVEGLNLPQNIQTNKFFGQSYLIPPLEGSENYVFYPTYALGDKATKVVGLSAEQQLQSIVDILRAVGAQHADDPDYQALVNMAGAIEQSQEEMGHQIMFTHWSKEDHILGAFKGDLPGDMQNSHTVYNESFKDTPGAIIGGEEYTNEFGFASGAVISATNMALKLFRRIGAEIAPNAPTGLAPLKFALPSQG